MKILVTGHMGLLGRHLARALKSQGHDIHGCDLRGGQDCRETFRVNDLRYDAVFHCAREHLPARQLGTDADFFDWVDRTQPRKVVYFSSDAVYPQRLQQEPYRLEEFDAAPDTSWGWVHYVGEQLALERGASVFRPFELYGEGGTGVFEQVAAMVRARVEPFVTPGCGRVLDFTHVSDAVAAVLTAFELVPVGPVNLCTGVPTAVDELALLMLERAGWEPRRFLCDVKDESYFRCGSPKAMDGLRPASVSLPEGVLWHL